MLMTKKPLKFEGVGEKIADLQLFNPRSMADRILGMGDVLSLIEKAEAAYDAKQAEALQTRFDRAHSGSLQAFKTVVLGNGAKVQQVSISPEQLQMLENLLLTMLKLKT